jgi:hypothetical protein
MESIQIESGPVAAETRPRSRDPVKRLAATFLLAVSLLAVGGVAVVSAQDGSPSPSPSAGAEESPGTEADETPRARDGSGRDCPDKEGSDSTDSSDSSS